MIFELQAKSRVFEVVDHVLNGTLDLDNIFVQNAQYILFCKKPGIWQGTLNAILQKSAFSMTF